MLIIKTIQKCKIFVFYLKTVRQQNMFKALAETQHVVPSQ